MFICIMASYNALVEVLPHTPNRHGRAYCIVRGFMFGDSWSPVIGDVLVYGLLNKIVVVFNFGVEAWI